MAGDPHPGRPCHLADTNDGNNPPDNGNVVELNNPALVLAGVNTTPYGWPTASDDPGCAPARPAPSDDPEKRQLRWSTATGPPESLPAYSRVLARRDLTTIVASEVE